MKTLVLILIIHWWEVPPDKLIAAMTAAIEARMYIDFTICEYKPQVDESVFKAQMGLNVPIMYP